MSNLPTDPAERSPAIDRVPELARWYGDGLDASSPTAEQWRRILDGPEDAPVTLINFFKLRAEADYSSDPPAPEQPGSGLDALLRYAAVSAPTLEAVGGSFLLNAGYAGTLIGDDEDWDLVAVGTYPNRRALLALFENDAYRAAFRHRVAAVDKQKVLVAAG